MQTMQMQIRLLLKELSEQGLHCLPFHFFKKQLHKQQILGLKNMEQSVRLFRTFAIVEFVFFFFFFFFFFFLFFFFFFCFLLFFLLTDPRRILVR